VKAGGKRNDVFSERAIKNRHPSLLLRKKNPWWGDILGAIFSNMETRRNVMEEKSPLRLILR
jgi:hypothetical protein